MRHALLVLGFAVLTATSPIQDTTDASLGFESARTHRFAVHLTDRALALTRGSSVSISGLDSPDAGSMDAPQLVWWTDDSEPRLLSFYTGDPVHEHCEGAEDGCTVYYELTTAEPSTPVVLVDLRARDNQGIVCDRAGDDYQSDALRLESL